LAGLSIQIAKRSQWHTFKIMPKRWAVERSFAWLEKNRRLCKNCERLLNTRLQLAFLALLLKDFEQVLKTMKPMLLVSNRPVERKQPEIAIHA
jgi:hypothetical protein